MSQLPSDSLVFTNRAVVNPQEFAGVRHIQVTNAQGSPFCFTVEQAAGMKEHEIGFNLPAVSQPRVTPLD